MEGANMHKKITMVIFWGLLSVLLFFGGEASALPLPVDSFFQRANVYFDSVYVTHLSSKLPEIEKIELKTYFLNNGLKNQKDGKKGAFATLEAKVDTFPAPFFHRPYAGLPEDVEAYFDSANFYFDSVNYIYNLQGGLSIVTDSYFQQANIYFDSINFIHQQPWPDETLKVEWKLHYLKHALKDQKEGIYGAFYDLEAKLDTLLGWPFSGTLPQDVEFYFFAANQYFDSVNVIHNFPPGQMPEIEKVELKLHYLKHALINEKEAEWWMFRELERKLDSLLQQDSQGLPRDVDSLFNCANINFDSVNIIHQSQGDPIMKVELKIYYLNKGLECQKEAVWRMFQELEEKIDIYSGRTYEGLPWQIDSFFISADTWFDSATFLHQNPQFPPLLNIEWKLHYLKLALKDVKEAEWLAFAELKRKLFIFDKIESELHYLKKALKYQKEAKWKMFVNLEAKLDTLLERPYTGLPQNVEYSFFTANAYFDSVNVVHLLSDMREVAKIEWKIHYFKYALEYQKDGMWQMFEELEWKLDSLLHQPNTGLPKNIDSLFTCANTYFDSVNYYHNFQGMAELSKIELKLYHLTKAMQCEKDAKWLSFQALEKKIDSLNTGVEEIQGDATLPDKFTLLQNYPNPFNPQTRIEFLLDKPSLVTVYIYNILGKKVKKILEERLKVGHYAIDWDGKDEKGIEVSSGIYFYRVQAGSMVQTKKMVLLK
jgi:hypothetical protein